jgi:hypothetical protein
MSSYSRGEVVLVRYPFSDLSGSKIRPAVIVSAPHISKDVFILPLTSKTGSLLAGEFALKDWSRPECGNSRQTMCLYCAAESYSPESWKVVCSGYNRPG